MTFNNKLDKFMKDNGYHNLKQLAIACDIPYTTLRDFYEKQSADNSRLSTIRKLSRFMGCSMDYLAYDDITDYNNGFIVDIDTDIIQIPVYGTIKAGIPIESQSDIIDYVDIPKDWATGEKKFYGLKISGDSMFPKYNDGDVVIFEQNNDNELYNGKDCAIMINGTESTFKKLLVNEQGIVLQPYNTSYDIMMYSKEQIEQLPIRVVGIAREKRTKIS